MRGLSYREKGDPELAISHFSRCIEMNPQDPYPWYDRGVAYERQGKAELAIEDYRAALRVAPTLKASGDALARLGAAP
jgi:regulator of sirC expression with transglutaminase-like and TPR domain